MRWVVGDVQGCARELDDLLRAIRYDPASDEVWMLGDLVNRGPDSLGALRLWRATGGRSLLGNHEIHLLLAATGRVPRDLRGMSELLEAPEADEMLRSLRSLPVLVRLPARGDGPEAWIVHAGLHPAWSDLATTARRLNAPPFDDERLLRDDVRFATSVRCCTADGERSGYSGPPEGCPAGYRPWGEHYRGSTLVVHGHWARRGLYRSGHVLGLDTGCVYGGKLTAWCQDEDRIVQVASRS